VKQQLVQQLEGCSADGSCSAAGRAAAASLLSALQHPDPLLWLQTPDSLLNVRPLAAPSLLPPCNACWPRLPVQHLHVPAPRLRPLERPFPHHCSPLLVGGRLLCIHLSALRLRRRRDGLGASACDTCFLFAVTLVFGLCLLADLSPPPQHHCRFGGAHCVQHSAE
jgi:hypothetical protein